jgi:hypothetical protein
METNFLAIIISKGSVKGNAMVNTFQRSVVFSLFVAGCISTRQQLGTTGSISGPADNVRRVTAAITEANHIYRDPAFWALVAERKWISSAAPDRAIPGDEVARSLQQIEPQEQTYSFKRFGWGYIPGARGGTNASTAQCVTNDKSVEGPDGADVSRHRLRATTSRAISISRFTLACLPTALLAS